MPHLPITVNRHDGEETNRRQLLAMPDVRRSLERVAIPIRSAEPTSMAMMASGAMRELLELIEALDRRVPQVERAGEASIARDAAALKVRALKRIDELDAAKAGRGEG